MRECACCSVRRWVMLWGMRLPLVAALLALALSACDTFVPIRATARIVVTDESIDIREMALIAQARDEWNDARPNTISTVMRGPKPGREDLTDSCGVVYVSRMHDSSECEMLIASGCTRSNGCNAFVLLGKPIDREDAEHVYLNVVKHELAHVFLGEQHSQIKGEMLSQPIHREDQAAREISPREASMVNHSD